MKSTPIPRARFFNTFKARTGRIYVELMLDTFALKLLVMLSGQDALIAFAEKVAIPKVMKLLTLKAT